MGPIWHYGLHSPGNSGDMVLLEATQKLFDELLGPQTWALPSLWNEVTPEAIERINTWASAVVVGGGGLFLRDTAPNKHSGWQWNLPIELIPKIKMPILLVAIGYNRFRGQSDFDPTFGEHLESLIDHGAWVGLRNWGSIHEVARYVGDTLADRIRWQPCPTTLLRRLIDRSGTAYGQNLAVNVPCDRHELRYGKRWKLVSLAIAGAATWMQKRGWTVHVVVHHPSDGRICNTLDKAKVPYERVVLHRQSTNEILTFYEGMNLVLGGRGHSMMIPFGLGVPIVGLVSHEKQSWFLADIGHPEWGVDVRTPNLQAILIKTLRSVARSRESVTDALDDAQRNLWSVTEANALEWRRLLGVSK